jgi:NAD(P)-dependent dehydrogenase (short-subunit alcohol dehydrogenase family)
MAPRYGGKGGAIVKVSSVAARLGGAFEFVDYAASKGAMDTLTVELAKEVADDGIRVKARTQTSGPRTPDSNLRTPDPRL